MSEAEQFQYTCEKIQHAYEMLGHKLGWRFLTGPSSAFNPSQEILLLTLNPAGNKDVPEHSQESSEAGSAYVVESWDGRPAGQAPLQRQIRLLFSELANRIGVVSGDALLSTSLTAHFVPFRSPSFVTLHNRKQSVAFASELWAGLLKHVSPRIIISMSEVGYDAVVNIQSSRHSRRPKVSELPVGWGSYTSTIARFANGPVVCRLPHLSRFAIFGRDKSAAQTLEILDLVATHYRSVYNSVAIEKNTLATDLVASPAKIKKEGEKMGRIHVVAEPSKPFCNGTARRRAWLLLQAFDGLSVDSYIRACTLMEQASGVGGDPDGWVKFFTATGRYEPRPGNRNASEILAEVRK